MNDQPEVLKLVEGQTHKTYGKLEGGKHRLLNFLKGERKMKCNKMKIYVRLFPCSQCGTDVTAIYVAAIKRWDLSCECGRDIYFKELNKSNWRRAR